MANVVETTSNRLYFVKETGNADLAHVWDGLEVKRVKDGYAVKKNARPELVSKAGCKVVA